MDIEAIIQRAKEKDTKALTVIYEMYYPQMIRVCKKIIRGDEDIAHDLVHDAFILAFVSLNKLRSNDKFGEWLTTIVRNVALKYRAQEGKIKIEPLSSIGQNDWAIVDSLSAPDSFVNSKDILWLVEQLPEGYAKIFRLSVIEGFTHKEISNMLGIEPHSSSSQLSRAKKLLRRLIQYRYRAVIILLIISVPLYFMVLRHGKLIRNTADTPIESCSYAPEVIDIMESKVEAIGTIADTSMVALMKNAMEGNEDECLIKETVEDSIYMISNDSTDNLTIEEYLAGNNKGKRHKWQFLATGSLGPALAQNMYKLFSTDNIGNAGNVGSEAPTPIFPENVNTWEDYSKYLHFIEHENIPADTLALMKIADNNSGEITEREQHDKPITFSISLTKPLNDKWSIETGLQYSLLNSRFTMGNNGYAIVRNQKIHYVGLPLKLSYRMMDYKRLSMYHSAGITLHLPVYGKINTNYIVDWQKFYFDDRHISPSPQWAASISVGLQCSLAPDISIFIEPTANWFIPSGSKIHTIWTESPIMFTSPLGIRIEW